MSPLLSGSVPLNMQVHVIRGYINNESPPRGFLEPLAMFGLHQHRHIGLYLCQRKISIIQRACDQLTATLCVMSSLLPQATWTWFECIVSYHCRVQIMFGLHQHRHICFSAKGRRSASLMWLQLTT